MDKKDDSIEKINEQIKKFEDNESLDVKEKDSTTKVFSVSSDTKVFDKDDLTRQNGIDILYKTVIDTNPKRIASANKIKTSDKYFIHFSDIRIGQHDDKRINNIISITSIYRI